MKYDACIPNIALIAAPSWLGLALVVLKEIFAAVEIAIRGNITEKSARQATTQYRAANPSYYSFASSHNSPGIVFQNQGLGIGVLT
jgi:hypothetical protein